MKKFGKIRRFICRLFQAIFVFCAIGLTAAAQQVSLTPANQINLCNATDTLWIYMDNLVTGVKAADLKIGYDHNYLTVINVIPDPGLATHTLYTSIDNANDSVLINIAMLGTTFSGPGNFVGIIVTSDVEISSVSMTFLRSDLRNSSNQSISHSTSNASIQIDCSAPSITCPTDVSVQCSADIPAVNIGDVSVTDNFDANPTIVHVGDVSDNQNCPEIISRTYRATDDAGNSAECIQTITVDDTTPPVLGTCPSNITVSNAAGQCGANVSFTLPGATDNCTVSPSVNSDYASGSYFPVGTTTVTVTATDDCGNTSQCTFTVTVNDNEAPVLGACPADITVPNDAGICGAVVTFSLPAASDNCPGVTVASSPASGFTFPVGTTMVTVTATDAHSNTTQCTFNVTVNDLEPPVLGSCPSDVIVSNDAGTCGAVVTFSLPAASDNCAVSTITASPASGSTFPVGTTVVTVTATDAYSNIDQCTFNVTVNDTEDPVLASCPGDVTVANDPGICGALVTFTVPTASDNCSVSSVVASPPSGSTFSIGTTLVTVTATDASSNTDICTFNITVNDTTKPVITCPADITVGCTDPTDPSSTGTASASDNCSVQSLTYSDSQTLNIIARTWRAVDPSANYQECIQTITINDNAAPTLETIVPSGGGYYNTAPTLTHLVFNDDCGLDDGFYQIDGYGSGGWITLFTDHASTNWDGSPWTIPGFAGLSEGTHTVYFRATDDIGRVSGDGGELSWQFYKDTQAPSAPTNFVVQPGHNKVSLSWSNAVTDFDHTIIMRSDWYAGGHGYPEYDDDYAEGPYPDDTISYDLVYSGSGISHTDNYNLSNSTRDVYHYTAFTVDAAGNVSSAVSSPAGRATSYWLGDRDKDGVVYYLDLVFLSNCYWATSGSGSWDAEFDIGPTHNGSPKGIPTTDNIVNFEDLVIFALNFDAVAPKLAPILPDADVTGPLTLALTKESGVADEELVFNVRLSNNSGTVKAVHFTVPFDFRDYEVVAINRGIELAESSYPLFFDGRVIEGQIDVSLAVLGRDVTLGGSGTIATIHLRALNENAPKIFFGDVDLRNLENERITAETHGSVVSSEVFLPTSFSLEQNVPNPFNPWTVISYQIPKSGEVSLVIYNIQGQVVKTLVQGHVEAGQHLVRWDGYNDQGTAVSSGIYLYRIEYRGLATARKMTLIK